MYQKCLLFSRVRLKPWPIAMKVQVHKVNVTLRLSGAAAVGGLSAQVAAMGWMNAHMSIVPPMFSRVMGIHGILFNSVILCVNFNFWLHQFT